MNGRFALAPRSSTTRTSTLVAEIVACPSFSRDRRVDCLGPTPLAAEKLRSSKEQLRKLAIEYLNRRRSSTRSRSDTYKLRIAAYERIMKQIEERASKGEEPQRIVFDFRPALRGVFTQYLP